MSKKVAKEYPAEIVREAYIRNMKPEDYVREMGDCDQAVARLAEIDRKNLDEMKPHMEEINEQMQFSHRATNDHLWVGSNLPPLRLFSSENRQR